MFKKILIVLIIIAFIGLGLNIKLMYAQKKEKDPAANFAKILDKLDQVLDNQEIMKKKLAEIDRLIR